jgi:GNAT superfamily N-acetyltransferase
MTNPQPSVPDGLRLTLQTEPPPAFRAELGQLINGFHAETVPLATARFTLRLDNAEGRLVGGLSAVASWGWLFVDAVWVDPALRTQGAGRALMARAEHQATALGCHSVWLDTFQARGFYEAVGYTVFGTLEDYPARQSRVFMRKRLV